MCYFKKVVNVSIFAMSCVCSSLAHLDSIMDRNPTIRPSGVERRREKRGKRESRDSEQHSDA